MLRENWIVSTFFNAKKMVRATIHNRMRIYHRYLGFFLAGIMAVYSISGVLLIFRDTSFLKREKKIEQTIAKGLNEKELGKAIKNRNITLLSNNGDMVTFAEGSYNKKTGEVKYVKMVLPVLVEKLNKLHKADTNDSLFYLNIFFGASLLFFVLSSFWMFLPKTTIFKKGLYFTAAGVVLTLLLLFI